MAILAPHLHHFVELAKVQRLTVFEKTNFISRIIQMKQILLGFFLLTASFSQAQQTDAKGKIITLRRFMEKYHYAPKVWNDSTSAVLFDLFIKNLDEEHLLFTAEDLAKLQIFRTQLDDELLGKQWKFFDQLSNVFAKRLQKVDSMIVVNTAKPLTFQPNESFLWPNESIVANDVALQKRWAQYIQHSILNELTDYYAEEDSAVLKNPKILPKDFAKQEVKIRDEVKVKERNYILRLAKPGDGFANHLLEKWMEQICINYDPHSAYFNQKSKEEFENLTSAFEFGTGMDLVENEDGDAEIDHIKPGSPAWRKGEVKKGDVITKIKVGDKPEKSIAEFSQKELAEIFTSNTKEKVMLIIKTKEGESKSIELQKEKMEDEEAIVQSFVLNGAQKIGYIKLPGFYSREDDTSGVKGCANDVAREVVKLNKDTIKGLILDLRNNGGGIVQEALELAGIFIDRGPICMIKEKEGKTFALKDPNVGQIYAGPMIVMINSHSASASELTSAALQDYNRAMIVGSTTYGKGTGQQILPMDTSAKFDRNKKYESFVKVTDMKFYRINGTTVQWKGVIPDISLKSPFDLFAERESNEPTALLPDTSRKGYYTAGPKMAIDQLAAASKARMDKIAILQNMQKIASTINEQKSGMYIPLQWAAFQNMKAAQKKLYPDWDLMQKDIANNAFEAANNNFDKVRYQMMLAAQKEMNKENLQKMQKDIRLGETYNIMLDWLKK
jgi:carboxyl-terminal processing protease